MPYYRDKLLSAWGNERFYEVGRPPAPIDPDTLANARRGPGSTGLIAPNSRKVLRNQIDSPVSSEPDADSVTVPKYLSDKTRAVENGTHNDKNNGVGDIIAAFAKFALITNTTDVPHGYKELRIRYGGPRGVQDFDFG